jgi:hypothetical protein
MLGGTCFKGTDPLPRNSLFETTYRWNTRREFSYVDPPEGEADLPSPGGYFH